MLIDIVKPNTCNIDRIIEDIRNKNLWEVSRELFKLITLINKEKLNKIKYILKSKEKKKKK